MTTLGEKIRLSRLQKGFSQENMADMLCISTTAYGDIERNKTDLTVSRLEKIADLLQTSPLLLLEKESPQSDLAYEKLKAEKERYEIEALYWREKYENNNRQQQFERPKIGFGKAS